MLIVRLPTVFTGAAAMSAGSVVIAKLRTMISRGPACK